MLYDPVQCQNGLYSRMALLDDRFLAIGCNTGNIALWDVTTPRPLMQTQKQINRLWLEPARDGEEEWLTQQR